MVARAWAGVGILLLLSVTACAAGGGDSDSNPSPTPTSSLTSARPSPTSPTDAASPPAATDAAEPLSAAALSRGLRELATLDTGTFTVSLEPPPSAEELRDLLPTVSGAWSFARSAGLVSAVSSQQGTGAITINQVLVTGQSYSQILYRGSMFTPSCWMRVPTPRGETVLPPAIAGLVDAKADSSNPQTNATLLLTDVLGALGFQKLASTYRAELSGLRVPVRISLRAGAITGWFVTATSVGDGVEQAGITGSGDADPVMLFRYAGNAAWAVRFDGLGTPVTIKAPPAADVIGPTDTQCPG